MHFHLPKPLHGWRAFIGEVGVIVLGVLIALGAEQAAEAYHHREQVRQGEEALKANYVAFIRAAASIKARATCVADRISEIRAILDEASVTHQLPRIGPIPKPLPHRWEISVWDAMIASQAAGHLAADKAFLYAGIAHSAHQIQLSNLAESDAWAPLGGLTGPARSFGDAQEATFRAALSRAENQSFIVQGMADNIQARILKTGLVDNKTVRDAQKQGVLPLERAMCEPIIVRKE